jgi:radical SAM modification target selenobiotic family peptide
MEFPGGISVDLTVIVSVLPLAGKNAWTKGGMIVDKEHVKKILAGLSIAGLLTGAGMTTPSFGASG